MWKELTGFLYSTKWHHEVQFWSADLVEKTVQERRRKRWTEETFPSAESLLLLSQQTHFLFWLWRHVLSPSSVEPEPEPVHVWSDGSIIYRSCFGARCVEHQTCVNNSAIQNFPRIYDQQRIRSRWMWRQTRLADTLPERLELFVLQLVRNSFIVLELRNMSRTPQSHRNNEMDVFIVTYVRKWRHYRGPNCLTWSWRCLIQNSGVTSHFVQLLK